MQKIAVCLFLCLQSGTHYAHLSESGERKVTMGKNIMQQFLAESLRSFKRNAKEFSFMGQTANIVEICPDVHAVCIGSMGAICNIHGNHGNPVAIVC